MQFSSVAPLPSSFDSDVPIQLHHEDLDDVELVDTSVNMDDYRDNNTGEDTGIGIGFDNENSVTETHNPEPHMDLHTDTQSAHQNIRTNHHSPMASILTAPLNSHHSISTSTMLTQSTIIILYLCLNALIYIVICVTVKGTLTLWSLCFQVIIICFSGIDSYIYVKRRLLVNEIITNISVQLTTLITIMIYGNTSNASVIIGCAMLTVKIIIMLVYCLGILVNLDNGDGDIDGQDRRNQVYRRDLNMERDNTSRSTRALWMNPIDLSEDESIEWSCVICLESDPRQVVKLRNCQHMLHFQCAKTLVLSNHTLCPICKTSLF